ncbi:MAG: phosphoenolpyruvate--protein phosphotransferase, partial [Myxococcales bacterium]|nr:phosphoenolpyruvate--protein phosphotransferase [Myxococcales bacterium]
MKSPIDDPIESLDSGAFDERAGMQTLEGIGVSPGIAIAPAYPLDRRHIQVPKRMLLGREVDAEIERLDEALKASVDHLREIRARADRGEGQDHLFILDTHLMILEDRELRESTVQAIRGKKINAEWALKRTVEKLKSAFDVYTNEYLRERASDVDHIGNLILRNLLGLPEDRIQAIGEPSVVVAHDLSPA